MLYSAKGIGVASDWTAWIPEVSQPRKKRRASGETLSTLLVFISPSLSSLALYDLIGQSFSTLGTRFVSTNFREYNTVARLGQRQVCSSIPPSQHRTKFPSLTSTTCDSAKSGHLLILSGKRQYISRLIRQESSFPWSNIDRNARSKG